MLGNDKRGTAQRGEKHEPPCPAPAHGSTRNTAETSTASPGTRPGQSERRTAKPRGLREGRPRQPHAQREPATPAGRHHLHHLHRLHAHDETHHPAAGQHRRGRPDAQRAGTHAPRTHGPEGGGMHGAPCPGTTPHAGGEAAPPPTRPGTTSTPHSRGGTAYPRCPEGRTGGTPAATTRKSGAVDTTGHPRSGHRLHEREATPRNGTRGTKKRANCSAV